LVALVSAAVAVWWLRRPFPVAVEGRSMAPALQPGDFLLAMKPKRLRPGCLVVVEHPSRERFDMIKRLTVVPGHGGLGPGEYWVEGDAADASTDSRTFGPVSGHAIKGVVVARYWPPTRAAWLLSRVR
jgi:nickel-type superoxide dismutase maturation protease